MSIRTWLMPAVSARLLSRQRLLRQRAAAERGRRAAGRRHQLHYFHQVDDPYSTLVAQVLPALRARYDVDLLPHVAAPPSDAAAPDRERLVAYSRCDAARLARHRHLHFVDPGRQPAPQAVQRASAVLVAAVSAGRFVELAGPVSASLWHEPERLGRVDTATADLPSSSQVAAHLAESAALRQRLGHYLGAMFFYAGEWYWGIDRLHHLERRLQDLGAQRAGVSGLLFAPEPEPDAPLTVADPAAPIDFFFSLRSPYSAIAAPRVLALGRRSGAPVRLRYVLPMVMRGLPVPAAKRRYISRDAAREAFVRGVDFGRLNDPVGRPTERGLSLMPFAECAGKGPAYLLSFMHGVWAEGVDAGSDHGLRRIVERAGLPWDAARAALADASWRGTAEANRVEMLGLGLWGVPSFRVRDMAVWGQDRLWAVEEALRAPDRVESTERPT